MPIEVVAGVTDGVRTSMDDMELVTLGSGLQILSRKPDIMAFLAKGLIPEEVYPWRDSRTPEAIFNLAINGIIVAEKLMISCCVDPMIVPGETPPGHDPTVTFLGTSDIDLYDKIAYLRWATSGFNAEEAIAPQHPNILG